MPTGLPQRGRSFMRLLKLFEVFCFCESSAAVGRKCAARTWLVVKFTGQRCCERLTISVRRLVKSRA